MADGMMSLAEVMVYLELDRHHIENLIKKKKLRAYRVGGTYIRFRKQDVERARFYARRMRRPESLGLLDRIRDMWSYYSFYVLSLVLIVLLVIALVLQ